ncbi:hypothetical protein DAT35_31580 [Vitiosangium sp. GDMCC 1.1324]|nr:hypothetical protein DAT35_31580 [Vitiosangium sp. GDMCC 1.1324]
MMPLMLFDTGIAFGEWHHGPTPGGVVSAVGIGTRASIHQDLIVTDSIAIAIRAKKVVHCPGLLLAS